MAPPLEHRDRDRSRERGRERDRKGVDSDGERHRRQPDKDLERTRVDSAGSNQHVVAPETDSQHSAATADEEKAPSVKDEQSVDHRDKEPDLDRALDREKSPDDEG